jgi:hypothetical protein
MGERRFQHVLRWKPSRLRHASLRRSRRTVIVVLAGGLAAAGVAVAASGTFSVGSVVPTGESTVAPDHRTTVDQRVLAEGTTPVAGPWWITTYQSERMVDSRGAEMQPPGFRASALSSGTRPRGYLL